MFDYPEHVKVDDGKNKKEVEVVKLSTTVKVKARNANKGKTFLLKCSFLNTFFCRK